jgi:predicted nucleic acid-binding protein
VTAIVVADASVVVKWFSADRPEEDDVEAALQLLYAVFDNRVRLQQPPHWLAEVAAVLTRLSPETATEDIADLHVMEVDEVRTLSVYERASQLARSLGQHLFDTLYHAVALETRDATLVTADERYFRLAAPMGSIELLSGSVVEQLLRPRLE